MPDRRRQLKIPRNILAQMTDSNPQAIKALEQMQLDIFDLLPKEIQDIIDKAASEAMQAAMIANQIRDSLELYLQPVGVPVEPNVSLDSVAVAADNTNPLDAITPIFNETNYLVSV